MDLEHLWSLVISVFIGALIGTERTLRHQPQRGDFAGLRTFILLATSGAISAWIARGLDNTAVFVAGMACTTVLLATAYVVRAGKEVDLPGYTTEIAGAIVFLLGGATVFGHAPFAVAMAILTSGVLALKDELHTYARKLTPEELRAALRLLFASFVVLPVLPREPVDPWGALNPYELWLLVVLISALSMAGYVAVRWTDVRRGTLLTGALGGLVSSTAVTMSLARRSREAPGSASVLCGGILLSWAVMFVRVVVEVALLSPSLLVRLAPPLLGTAVALAAAAFAFARQAGSAEDGAAPPEDALTKLRSPFQLRAAIPFAAFFGLVLLTTKAVSIWFPASGLLALAALSGAADVDAITLSVAGMAGRGEIGADVAASAIVMAAASNSLMKLIYGVALGHAALRRRLVVPGLLILAVGGLALVA